MPNTYSVEYNGERTTFDSMEEAERHIRENLGHDTYSIEDRRDYGLAGGERVSGVGMGEGERLLNEARPLDSTGSRFMGFGYYDPAAREWVPPGRDMIDGGGAGRSGPTFQGGPFSGILNAMGVRPAGYRERLENNMAPTQSLRPRARPSQGIFSAYTPGAGYTLHPVVGSAVTPASAGNTSANVPGYAMPLETPQPYTPPTYGANIGTAEILPLLGASNPMTYQQPVPGVSSSYLPNSPFPGVLPLDYAPPSGPPNGPAPGVKLLDYAPIGGSSLLTQSDVNYLAAQLGVSPSQHEARAGDIATPQERKILGARPQYSGPTYEASRAADARSGGMVDLQLDPLDRPLLDPGNVIGMRENAIERSPTPMVTDRLDTFMFPQRYYPDSSPSIGPIRPYNRMVSPGNLRSVSGY